MGLARNTYSGRAELFFRINMLPQNSFDAKQRELEFGRTDDCAINSTESLI
jgi:hypothetical protein